MKYLDEYRNETVAQKLMQEIRRLVTRPCMIIVIIDCPLAVETHLGAILSTSCKIGV